MECRNYIFTLISTSFFIRFVVTETVGSYQDTYRRKIELSNVPKAETLLRKKDFNLH